jgi:inorganic pyrophosphatase
MFYPGNYGFIPHTLSADGDPCDVLVVGQVPVVPGAVIRCRPVGALMMEDEAGMDEKILAVPIDKLHPFYTGIKSYEDLPVVLCEQIAHFFQHYKDLERGKWVKVVKWLDVGAAEQLVLDAIARAKARADEGSTPHLSRAAAASMRLRSEYFFTSISMLTKPRSFIIATFFCSASRFGRMSGAW